MGRQLLILLIKFYRLGISPLFPATCRFHPSCSQYTLTAIHKYGVIKGTFLGFKRLCRCHPFTSGGYYPVP